MKQITAENKAELVDNFKCPASKENIGLSAYGKSPCELCALMESMREKANEIAKQYERMKKELLKLHKVHLKCAGCGLCFGESHIATPSRQIKELGTVCHWCAKQIDKTGLDKFMKLLKQQSRGERKNEAKNSS